jgi:hypothetical protein
MKPPAVASFALASEQHYWRTYAARVRSGREGVARGRSPEWKEED